MLPIFLRKNLAEYRGEIRARKTFQILIGPRAGGMSKAQTIYIDAEDQQQAVTRAKRMQPGNVIYSITG